MSNRFFQYISKIFGGSYAKSGPTFEELLQKIILQDKTHFITGFKSFQADFNVEFNDFNYAHLQALIEKGQTDHFNKAEFISEHTLETLTVARLKAQDNKEYIALFYDPVDFFSNPEVLKIYKIA
ncbi:hypothetical protein GFS24_19945 [Chitinophaga sp. SYP-B3965]|uniref:hypothetical protein n=1 Tax=Chitinophaga sp. SYP-B3965 TaxID=2663120 RepID=UPI0012995503|nr:hypothetical protein [Chitinophaga sp. SYP-B3965]MRG47403.1 hypothetical protein [Chitinophaga sp. SYP-B3965]